MKSKDCKGGLLDYWDWLTKQVDRWMATAKCWILKSYGQDCTEKAEWLLWSQMALASLVVISARVSDPDPDWIRIQSGQWIRIRNRDPDPGGQKWPTKVEKIGKSSCFDVLDGIFWELKASSVTWTYFMEA